MALDYNKVMEFMKEFKADIINRFDEIIIDEPTNTYVSIKECKDIEDVKTRLVFALCRPIGKGLDEPDALRLLRKLNNYFEVDLTRKDMLLMYQELCYKEKIEDFKLFIENHFPIHELKNIRS